MSGSTGTPATAYDLGREEQHWIWRLLHRLADRWRPRRGWTALLLMLWLQLLFTLSLRNTNWANFDTAHLALEFLSLGSMLFVWVCVRPNPRPMRPKPRLHRLGWSLGLVVLGLLLWLQQMTNLVGRWLQWNPAQGMSLEQWLRDLATFFASVGQDSVQSLATRFDFWLEGVLGGGAQQDDLVFVGLISLLLLVLAVQASWMFLAGHSILLTMTPSLWLFALMLYYSQGPRLDLVVYLASLFLLWTWGHHQQLVAQWTARRVDYPEGVGPDRALAVVASLVVMAVLSLTLPSIRIDAMREWANSFLHPIDEATVDLGQRMFPDLQPKFHGRRQSAAGGLPNSFLLGNAPDLSTTVAMVVDTNFPFAEETGFYMRGMTFQYYDGKGWSNDPAVSTRILSANEPFQTPTYPHTREIWQFVELHNASSVIYAIPEPLQFSINVRPVQDREHDQVIMYRSADRNTYNVRSAMPLLSDSVLAAVSMDAYSTLDETDPLAPFLQVPPTITERTRQLAVELTRDQPSPYAKGIAVEQYLRTFPYDLDVSLPGPDTADLADHFLFELQRGYCDYYATAFTVLMRLSGIPTRFAVGYAPGYWEPYTEQWTITDAQAHSWPEIWLPEMGWIPFEPTAGRSARERDYIPLELAPVPAGEASASTDDGAGAVTSFQFGPQMWFWVVLVLMGGGLVLFWRVRTYRDPDPWAALLAWGQRLGSSRLSWQTEREYAADLHRALQGKPRLPGEDLRVMAGYLHRITEDVVVVKYAGPGADPERERAIGGNWAKLRTRLWRLWVLRI